MIQWLLVYPESCAAITTVKLQTIFTIPEVTPHPGGSHFPVPLGHLFRPCCPLLAITNLLSVSELASCGRFISLESDSMWLCVSGFFYSANLCLNNIPLYESTTFIMDIWVAAPF